MNPSLNKITLEVVRSFDPALAGAFEAVSARQWNKDVQEMIAVAARGKGRKLTEEEEEEEANKLRFSKNKSQALAKVLKPVNLSEAMEKEYTAIFFPKKKDEILAPFDYIAGLSAYLYGATTFLRYLIVEASYISSDSHYTSWGDQVARYSERHFSGRGRDGSSTVNSFNPDDMIKAFLSPERASSGDSHMIKDSAFYKEGIDFIVTGSKTATAVSGIVSTGFSDQLEHQFMQSQDSMMHDPKYLDTYASEQCQKVIKAYREILDVLFGADKWKKFSFGGGMERMSMTFDARNIQSRIERALGAPIPELAKLLPAPMQGSTRLKYTHMAIVATPMLRWLARVPEAEDRMATVMTDMSDMYTTLGFNLGVCPVYSLPRELAAYVCQAGEKDQLSYVSLNQWFSIWSRQLLVPKSSKSVIGGRLKPMSVPRYVLPLSKAMDATEVRKREGMYAEQGRTDAKGLYINSRGLPEVMPDADSRDSICVAAEYEKQSEILLRAVFESDLPAKAAGSKITGQTRELLRSSGKSLDTIDAYNDSLDKYKKDFSGATLYYDWDTNIHHTVSVDAPTTSRVRSMAGSARPTATIVADLLGYDFAKPGERTIRKLAFETLYMIHPSSHTSARKTPEEMNNPTNMFDNQNNNSPYNAIFATYGYLFGLGKAQALDAIIAESIKELDITWAPNIENNEQYDMFANLISDTMAPNVGANFLNEQSTQQWLNSLMRSTWQESTVARGSVTERSLRRLAQMAGSNYHDMVDELPYRFDPMTDPLGDIANMYKLLGGLIFKKVCNSVADADKTLLFGSPQDSIDPFNSNVKGKLAPSNAMSTLVLPHALLFGYYAPARDQIFTEAEISVGKTQPDDSITEDDIRVAGAAEGSMMFPHQVKCHKTLRNRPEFAILDVAPGGGKTSLGLTDIGAMLSEISSDAHFRPLILCPDGLIPNWCNDAKLFFGTKWNLLPINSEIYNRWGEERLTEMVKQAPRNTIIVAGVHFLTMVGKDRYYIGGGVVTVSPTVEFIKQFQPNYIGIDESHWFKNPASARTELIRSITTASNVEYLRLFTGTFIANRVDDAIGQASLFNAAALRHEDIFGDANLQGGDTNPETVKEGAQRARRKLETHGAVIRATRKEWAFLLAQPIERFITVNLAYDQSDIDPATGLQVTQKEIDESSLHDALYAVVLERSLEEIQKLAETAKRKKKEDDDEEGGSEEDGSADDLGLDEDDPLAVLSAEQLRPYLQRMERLITSPEKDPLFEEIFGAAGITKYVPRKVKEVYSILDEHFKPTPWQKGGQYKELDLVGHTGKLWLARKLDLTTPNRMMLSETSIGISPDQLTDIWREEPEGKVIIFTRYKNTVDSLYENLPAKYKAMAVPFHGGIANAKGNLHLFKTDPKIKILIANEQSIKEGHNMQMASRIIRVEWPWTPGDLEQSKSRILRPDVKANRAMLKGSKSGELYREAIFLDWVVANKTMEVDKHCRLTWKIVEKAFFDEDNKDNLAELSKYDLAPISLSIDAMRNRTDINSNQIADYYGAYATVNAINRREFHEMRIKEMPSMRMLPTEGEGTNMPKDSSIFAPPFVAGQEIDDPKGYGFQDALSYVQLEGNEEYLENPRLLIGKPVMTDMGPGVLVKCQPKYEGSDVEGSKASKRDNEGNLIVDKMSPIASMHVQLAGTDTVIKYTNPQLVFIATAVDIKTQKAIFEKGRSPKLSKGDDVEDRKERERAEKEASSKKVKDAQDRIRAGVEKDNRQQGDKRRQNVKEGKPINAGVKSIVEPGIKREAAKRMKEAAVESAIHITLHPASFHDFLVLEMDTQEEEMPSLKKHGFRETGEYVYITTDRYGKFEKMLDYMDAHFHLSPASAKRLEVVQDAFEESKAALYKTEIAPHSALPLFFNVQKKIVTDRREVRPYPILLPREIMVAIDIATCPAIKKHIGKAVPGTGQKWTVSPGNTLYYANNKADMKSKVRELKAAGFIIDNYDELEAEIANVRFRAKK